jgi:serine/threonine protein kinase/Flp pilus assembly protein TadD
MTRSDSTAPPPGDTGERTRSPLSLLLLEQQRLWGQGTPRPVEAYLEQQPELRADASALLLLIHHEVELRSQRGEAPGLAEYQARFPHLASQVCYLFEVHRAMAEAPPPLTGPPALPGYAVLEEVGRGGMGVVYRAWQSEPLNRVVALKMIRPDAFRSPEHLRRFRTEAEAIARLQHPNVVQIYEFGEYEGQTYFALEWVGGGSLAQHLAGRAVPPRPAAALVATLARAVHHAHERGVIHRDLKPANVLLSFSGRSPSGAASPPPSERPLNERVPKVADFGLAKRLDVEGGQTLSGEILGTPSYMAPEQAAGWTREVGPATDTYALGAILYECLTGRPPFCGTSLLDTLDQVRSREPLPPRRLQPQVPRDLETICLKCLQKEPGRRYASALALAEDLERFGAGRPIRARRTPPWERATKWARRHPAAALLGAVSLAAVLAVVLGLWAADSRERSRRAAARAEAEGWLHAGRDALDRQQWQEARGHFTNALDRIEPETSLADLRWHYLLRGVAEVELGATDAAEADFGRAEEALRRVPNAEADYSLHLSRGLLHFRQQRLEEAGGDFEGAARLRPDDWQAYGNLAQVRRQQRRPEEARRALEEAVRRQPPPDVCARLQIEIGDLFYEAGEYDEALRACAALEADRPDYADLYRLRGLALVKRGGDQDFARAACAFDRYFLEGGRGAADVFRARGHAHLRRGDYPAALADYTEAFKFAAGADADLYLHRGWAYYFCEAWRLAVDDFDEAIRLRPDDGDAYSGRAYARVKLGQYRAGVRDAGEALRLGSATPEVLGFNVACVFAQAAGKVRADPKAADRDALEADYRGQAVANIRKALDRRATAEERWLFWRDQMLPDEALDPIRDGPEVRALHAELQQAAREPRR